MLFWLVVKDDSYIKSTLGLIEILLAVDVFMPSHQAHMKAKRQQRTLYAKVNNDVRGRFPCNRKLTVMRYLD